MNKTILMGRLTKDPEVRYTQGENPIAVARFNLAVQRKGKKDEADFINCVSFGNTATFLEKYVKKGTKIAGTGRIQVSSYEKDGKKYYQTDVVMEEVEFAESKSTSGSSASAPVAAEGSDFMNIPDDISEELPFN